jgi:hypothetical protein
MQGWHWNDASVMPFSCELQVMTGWITKARQGIGGPILPNRCDSSTHETTCGWLVRRALGPHGSSDAASLTRIDYRPCRRDSGG